MQPSNIDPGAGRADVERALDAARELVAVGVPVFVAPADPRTPIGFALPAGWQRTRPDPAAVDAWRPGDALCAVTGHTLDVIDVDPRNGGDLSPIIEAGMLPNAYAVASTPSGGIHRFVAALGVRKLGNVTSGVDLQAGVNGEGHGFVFLPPTVRPSKVDGVPRAYRWRHNPDAAVMREALADDDTGAALAEMVRRRHGDGIHPGSALAWTAASGVESTPPGPADAPPDDGLGDAVIPYDAALRIMNEAFNAFYEMDPATGQGFNAALNAAAYTLGRFVGTTDDAPTDYGRAFDLLYGAAEHTGCVRRVGPADYRPMGAAAVRATITSGLRAGMARPHVVGPREPRDDPEDGAGEADVAGPDTGPDAAARLIAEMLTPDQLDEQPNPQPLIQGVLDLDTTSWMIGKPGSYKSFVALDMAACVGRGIDWHGHATAKGTVVYLVAEGARGIKLRARAWRATYGRMDNVLFLPRPVQAADREAWAVLIEACRRIAPVLIVIDTQARVTVGLDENDNSEMMRYVERADALKRATRACVLTVHHIGRNGTDARGASSIDGAQDAELRVARTTDRRVTLHMDKQKDQDDTASIDLELSPVSGGTDEQTGRDLSSLVVVRAGTLGFTYARPWLDDLPENQAAIVGVVADLAPALGMTKAEAKRFTLERASGGPRPMAGSSFNRAWDSLVSKSILLRVEESQRYVLASTRVDDGLSD